ncbi:MAG: hypothetical protein AB8B63_11015 [Granulosicoccus sp.]
MKTVNEQIAEMQKKTMESLEPMQNLNVVAAQAFERIARKNYELMGDLVDYAVSQIQVPEGEANLQAVYEQKVAETKAFADKVNSRATEYVALAGELGDMVSSQSASEAQAAPEAKTPSKKKAAAKKTAEKAK